MSFESFWETLETWIPPSPTYSQLECETQLEWIKAVRNNHLENTKKLMPLPQNKELLKLGFQIAMNWNSTLVISYFESSRIPESTSLNILEIAAEYNNFEICEYLVKTCQFTHRISHALHTVASRGNLQIVKLFIEFGANPKTFDIINQDIVSNAVRSGNLDLIKYLDVSLDCQITQHTTLAEACKRGLFDIVQYFLKDCKFSANPETFDEDSAVWVSCKHGKLDILKLLVEYGAILKEFDQKSDRGKIAIGAALSGSVPLLKYLHELGVDLLVDDGFGTPFQIVVERKSIDAIKYLHSILGEKAKFDVASTLRKLVRENRLDVIQCLVSEMNIDVDSRNSEERVTPFMLAGMENNIPMMKGLLELGANLNATGVSFALKVALIEMRNEVFKFLLSLPKIDIELKDNSGATAFLYALHYNRAEELDLLIKAGVNVNAIDHEWENGLFYAATSFGMTNLAIEAGVKLNCVSKIGVTVLWKVFFDKILEYLLANGADPNLLSLEDGKSILETRISQNRYALSRTLLLGGAKWRIKRNGNFETLKTTFERTIQKYSTDAKDWREFEKMVKKMERMKNTLKLCRALSCHQKFGLKQSLLFKLIMNEALGSAFSLLEIENLVKQFSDKSNMKSFVGLPTPIYQFVNNFLPKKEY